MPRSVGTRTSSSSVNSPISRYGSATFASTQLAGLDPGEVVLRRADVPPAARLAVAVRPRAEAQVRSALPVPQVVPALVAGLRPVRDLVVDVAGRREHVARGREHVRLQIGVR